MVHSIVDPATGTPESLFVAGRPARLSRSWASGTGAPTRRTCSAVLGAKDERNGQNGALFAGFLKLLPVFLMVFPGTMGWIMYQHGAFKLGDRAQAGLQLPPGRR